MTDSEMPHKSLTYWKSMQVTKNYKCVRDMLAEIERLNTRSDRLDVAVEALRDIGYMKSYHVGNNPQLMVEIALKALKQLSS